MWLRRCRRLSLAQHHHHHRHRRNHLGRCSRLIIRSRVPVKIRSSHITHGTAWAESGKRSDPQSRSPIIAIVSVNVNVCHRSFARRCPNERIHRIVDRTASIFKHPSDFSITITHVAVRRTVAAVYWHYLPDRWVFFFFFVCEVELSNETIAHVQ